MGKRKNRAVISGVSDTEEPDASASPEPETAASSPAEPLGKLWTWTPDDAPPEVPLADRVADVIRDVEAAPPVKATDGAPVGVLWTWTPPAEGEAPPPPPAPPVEPEAADPAPAPVAPPPVVPMAPVFQPEVAPAPVAEPVGKVKIKAKRERRFGRRSEPSAVQVPEEQVEPVLLAPQPSATPPVEAPVFQADVAPAPVAEPVGKVKTKRERRRTRMSGPSAVPRLEEQVEPVVLAPEPSAPPAAEAPVFRATEVAPAPLAEPVGKVKIKAKRERRRTRTSGPSAVPAPGERIEEPFEEQAAPPPEPETELTTLRPIFRLDPDLVLPAPALLAPPVLVPQLDEPWLRVPPPRTGAPRGVRLAVGALVLATCAALPWVVPQIPDLFAEAVPEQSGTPSLPQTTFAPPTPVPSGGVEVNKSLAGKRLASAGTPLEVTVERLQVIKAPVVPISGQSGELIPPDDPELLGWWQEGAGVGAARGTSIITGHTVSGGGGAFDHLGELVAGDHVTVRTAAGRIEYIVRETQDLPVAELARKAKSIFQQTGDGRLVLITCSDFDGKVYRSNSVVYASPLEDIPKRKE